ncbi:deoxyguanosinetriphosphate triphosphohydrolase [Oceanibaculum indicum]|uniref:Deoxyguanosinetriphosphate triphosphohydrolase-like protein n=1 Tax=Oceanibaculum indicum TaxID=526216 RepID=A0A420WPP1_9PROT|nr:deoxyguanosinetriphosphate triphosphohydrolase [Oceanibaculum indicum]RKQ72994.1 dGTPase [Oceanibaculum indicum]
MSSDTSLAPYACDPESSRGRLHPEPEHPERSCFQRDRDRIIHSAAFRRLKHKTQVFVYHEGDHYRTRLTHSLEVAQIARSISRALGLNEDLAEALALAHDFGHTCFGHAGEEALDEAMQPYGGFDHNVQTLRVLTELEHRYADFDGLNLTWETLEGTVKHNGPVTGPLATRKAQPGILNFSAKFDLELDSFASLEAQVASLSDDIAYQNHDLDDGLRAGLFNIADIIDMPLVGPILQGLRKSHPDLDRSRLIHELVRRVINAMVTDLLTETRERLLRRQPKSARHIREAGAPTAAFSEQMMVHHKDLRTFLFERMYRHYLVNRMTSKARRIVHDLFDLLFREPQCLPTEWRVQTDAPQTPRTARVVADYIAGMTDRFALREYDRLFDITDRT